MRSNNVSTEGDYDHHADGCCVLRVILMVMEMIVMVVAIIIIVMIVIIMKSRNSRARSPSWGLVRSLMFDHLMES